MSSFRIDIDAKVASIEEAKDKIKSLSKEIEKIDKNIDLKVDPKDLAKGKQELEALKRTVLEVEKTGGSFGKVFDKNLKAVGMESKKTEKSIDGVSRSVNKLNSASSGNVGFSKLSNSAKIAAYDIKKTETQIDSLKQNLQQGLGQTLAFGAINGIQETISSSVRQVEVLDKIMTDISIVSGKTKNEMEDYRDAAGEAGDILGTLGSDYLGASLIYEQQGGMAAQYARELGEATVIASNITRESTDQMSEYLTSTINGFQLLEKYGSEAGTYVTDVFSKLGAASGSDLGEVAVGLSNVANIAKEGGFELEEISSMIATVSEVTRSAPQKVGNAFKSIITSFSQLREAGEDEINEFTGKVEKAFESAGIKGEISMFDNGKLRDAADIMKDLGGMWKTMNKESQALVSEAVAGKYQAETFKALMENQSRYADLLAQAYDSAGTAAQQQLVYMDSMEASADRFKNAWERASSAAVPKDLYKTVLEQGTRFLNLIGDQETAVGALSLAAAPLASTLGMVFGSRFAGDAVKNSGLNKMAEEVTRNEEAVAKAQYENGEITKANYERRVQETREIEKQRDILDSLGKEAGETYKKVSEELGRIQEQISDIENMDSTVKQKTDSYLSGGNPVNLDRGVIDREIKENQEIVRLNSEIEAKKEKIKGLTANETKELTKQAGPTQKINSLLTKESALLVKSGERININSRKSLLSATEQLKKQVGSINVSKEEVAVRDKGLASLKKINSEIDKAVKDSGNKEKHIENMRAELENVLKLEELISEENKRQLAIEEESLANVRQQKEGKKRQIATTYIEASESERTGNKGDLPSLKAEGSRVSDIKDGMEKISKESRIATTATKVLSGVAGTLPVIIGSINSALDGTADKGDVLLSTFQSIGTTLLFSGGIWGKIAGGIMLVGSVAADHLGLMDSELEKITKRNSDMVKQFLSIQESSSAALSSVISIGDEYNKFQGLTNPEALLADPEVAVEIKDSYKKLAEEMSKSRPDLVKYYNDEGVAILDLSEKYSVLLEQQKKASVQAQGMLEKNSQSFISEYEGALKGSGAKEDTLATDQKQNNKKLESAIKEGDSEKVEYFMDKISKASGSLAKLQEETKKTRDGINANVVSPFVNANEAIEKFVGDDKLVSKIKEINSSFVDTKEISGMLEKGMGEQTARYLENIESIAVKYGDMEKASTGAGDAMIESLKKLGPVAKELLKEEDFTDVIKSGKIEEKLSQEIENIKSNLLSSVGTRLSERSGVESELKGAEEELDKALKVASSGTDEELARVLEARKEVNGLKEEVANLSLPVRENISLFEGLSKSAEGVREGRDILKQTAEELVKVKDASRMSASELEALVKTTEGKKLLVGMGVDPASGEAMKAQVAQNYKAMEYEQKAYTNALLGNDNEYYKTWVDKNLQKLEQMTGLNKEELMQFENLNKLKAKFSSMTEMELYKIGLKGAQERNSLHAKSLNGFKKNEMNKVSMGEISSSEYLSFWEKAFYTVNIGIEKLENGGKGVFSTIGDYGAKAMSGISGAANDFFNTDTFNEDRYENRKKKQKPLGTPIQDAYKADIKKRKSLAEKARKELMAEMDKLSSGLDGDDPFSGANNPFDSYASSLEGFGGDYQSTLGDMGKATDALAKKQKEQKEKEVADIKLTLDEYYKLENQLKSLSSQYAKANKEKTRLYGANKLKAMEKEQTIMAKQAGTNEAYMKALKKEQGALRSRLSRDGFRTDGAGEITNLNEQLRSLEANANKLKGEEKEKAIERVKAIQTEATRYSDVTFNLIPNKEQAIADAKATFAQIAREKFEYRIKLVMDKDDLKNQAVETVKAMQDSWGKLDEKTNLTGTQMKMWLSQNQMYQEELKKLQANPQGMDENDRQDKIMELQKNILDTASKARNSYKELISIQEEFIKGSLDAVNVISSRYDNVIKKSQMLIDKQKELYGYKATEENSKLFDTQAKAIDEQISSLVDAQKWLISYRNTLDQNTASWKLANDEVNKLATQIEDGIIKKLDSLKAKFEMITSDMFEKFDKQFGLFGLSGAEEEFDKIISKQKEYMSGYDKLSIIGGKIAEINREIESTNDPNRNKELMEFRDKELQALMNQDKVSQSEYDRALKLYDIKMKELAIEERRDAKRIAQLVRLDSGEMGYEYVREETEDSKKEIDELQKAKDDLYSFDKGQVEASAKEIFKVIADYQEKLKKLQTLNLSPEEYKREAQKLLDATTAAIKESEDKMGKWSANMAKDGLSGMMDLLNKGNLDTASLGIDPEAIRKINEGLAKGTLTFEDMVSGNLSSFADSAKITEEEAKTAVGGILDFIMEENDALSDALDVSIGKWTSSAQENVNQLGNAYDQYITKATETLTQYNSVTGDLNKLLQETTLQSKKTQAQIDTQTQSMIATTRANDGASKSVKQLEEKLVGKNGKSGLFGSMVQLVKHMGKELQPEMIRTGRETDVLSGKTNNAGNKYNYMFKESRSAYNQVRQFNSKNLSHSYVQFDTISNKAKNIADRYTTMGKNADVAKQKTVNLSNELMRLPGFDKMPSGSGGSGYNKDQKYGAGSNGAKYASGGYTGSWRGSQSNREGRLAVLHQKELVLNEKDTKNMLEAVSITRGLASKLTSQQASNENIVNRVSNRNTSNYNTENSDIKQDIKIINNFEGETTVNSITEAMNNALSEVSTYIGKKN